MLNYGRNLCTALGSPVVCISTITAITILIVATRRDLAGETADFSGPFLNWFSMCGRYRLTAKERYIRNHFGLEDDVSWAPRWNIAPTQQIPIVRQDNKRPKRTFGLVRWG
jgi:hypothetical protein